jgi:hypothetical protein
MAASASLFISPLATERAAGDHFTSTNLQAHVVTFVLCAVLRCVVD